MSRLADGIAMARALPGLMRRDGWSAPRLGAHQKRALTAMIQHAVRESPFYRQLYAAAGVKATSPLTALPIVDKRLLTEDFDAVVCCRRLRRVDLERHLERHAGSDPVWLGQYRAMT